MKFRVARHTTDIRPITNFYTGLLGLQILGSFEGHNGYDGIFLGLPTMDWHLEFTISNTLPVHQPDEDDLLVFYPNTTAEYQEIIDRFNTAGILAVKAKNPYWQVNGVTYTDPDGYGVIIVKK